MKSSTLAWAATALLTAGPLAVAQKNPAPIDLGTLGGSASIANGLNAGDVVVGGGNVFSDAYQHAFYVNSLGYLEDMGSFIGVYGNSIANGISTAGEIVGASDQVIDSDGDIATHAFLFVGSRKGLEDLGTNGGTLASANAVGNGQVVGASTNDDDVSYVAFLWIKTKGIASLNTLAHDDGNEGYNSYAYGINTTGTAVGNSDSPDGTTHAVAWTLKGKKIVDLTGLGGSYAQANAVNNAVPYLVVGFGSLPGDSQIDAFVGTEGVGLTDIGNLGGSYAQANGVNDSGVVVGSSNITGDTDVHAFVWTAGGGMVDLNTLLPGGSPFIELNSANAIGADGTIVGVGTAQDGQSHAFVW
jgi:probable HAF family extracellular repeat protein